MSTDLYGIRILETKPEAHKIKLKVFVVYYDTHFKSHQPLPNSPFFFLCALGTTQFGDGGLIDEEVASWDKDWVNKNAVRFIKNIELIATKNFPLTDYSTFHDFYYERGGTWVNEDKLVQATYEIEVTDKKYIDHLNVGMSWGTTAYEPNPPTNPAKQEKSEQAKAIVAHLESVYQRVSNIVEKSETILSPVLTNDNTMEEVQDRWILLFNEQRKNGNFKKTIIYLKEQVESNTLKANNNRALDDLIYFLKDVFHHLFYELVPEKVDGTNLQITINSLKNDDGQDIPQELAYCLSRLSDEKLENPSSNTEIKALQKLTFVYLDLIKTSLADFEGVIGWIE